LVPRLCVALRNHAAGEITLLLDETYVHVGF
jgi:hypothetical protein